MSDGAAGFVYVATGDRYFAEAVASARTLRHWHHDFPICLITDAADPEPGVFDLVVHCRDVERKPIDKVLAIRCPYERAVFLDTDTRVCGDLTPLIALLDAFDIAVVQDVNRGWDYELPGVPLAFSEFNTGVIAFRRTAAVIEFFEQWRDTHTRLRRDVGFVNDQPAFRDALFHSRLRVAPLPSEFHFLANVPNSLFWNVRLIHARGNLEDMQRKIDEVLGRRVYIPDVGVVGGFHGRRGWLRTTLRMAGRMMRLVLRPPTDSAEANPGQWWRDERRVAGPPTKPS